MCSSMRRGTWAVSFVENDGQRWFGFVLSLFGCLLKWWYPQNTSKCSFLVGKPMVVGYHHFRNPPFASWWCSWYLGYSCIHSLKMLLCLFTCSTNMIWKHKMIFGMWYLTWPMVKLRRFYKQITTWCFYVCFLTPILKEDIQFDEHIFFEWVNSTTK